MPKTLLYIFQKNLIGNYIDNKLIEKSSKLNLQNVFDQIQLVIY